MIDESDYHYYLTYILICVIVGVLYLKIKSSEQITITTKEFKEFQSNFSVGYATMILGELLSIGTLYHTITALNFSLEKVTRLYIVSIVSMTIFGVILEIIDIGTRRNKCIISALLFSVSMGTVFGSNHFELMLLGRILYGAATSLLHSVFDSYLVHEHSTMGFPDDWLNQTFSMLTHSMAFVACLAGALGQTAVTVGVKGPIILCFLIFIAMAIFIMLTWPNDTNSSKFLLSSFTSSISKTVRACNSNRQMLALIILSSCCEAAITVFTYYWAPYLSNVIIGTHSIATFPYQLIFSTYVAGSMCGAYAFQLFSTKIGPEGILQFVLVSSTASYFLGSMIESPIMIYSISLLVNIMVGVYWPSIGYVRGKVVPPEMRTTSLCLSKLLTLIIAVPMLTLIHHSPLFMMATCSALNGIAVYLQNSFIQSTGTSIGYESDGDAN